MWPGCSRRRPFAQQLESDRRHASAQPRPLTAFKRDASQLRYRDRDDLMDYCRFSASPVGRHVLALHGIGENTWPANDALCSALQVINHIQDCACDYRELDRVYVPLNILKAHRSDPGGTGAVEIDTRPDGCLAGNAGQDGTASFGCPGLSACCDRYAPEDGGVRDLRYRRTSCQTAATARSLCDNVKLSKPSPCGSCLTGIFPRVVLMNNAQYQKAL